MENINPWLTALKIPILLIKETNQLKLHENWYGMI